MINHQNNPARPGFSLIETLAYIFITAMLLTTISSLLMSNFNIRRQLKTSSLIYNDARFIITQLNNKIHTASAIADLRPNPEQIIFYPTEASEFYFQVENNNLIYREAIGSGPGGVELILNSTQNRVSDFILTPIADSHGNLNKGILINFTLSTGNAINANGYLSENFQTFISLR